MSEISQCFNIVVCNSVHRTAICLRISSDLSGCHSLLFFFLDNIIIRKSPSWVQTVVMSSCGYKVFLEAL